MEEFLLSTREQHRNARRQRNQRVPSRGGITGGITIPRPQPMQPGLLLNTGLVARSASVPALRTPGHGGRARTAVDGGARGWRRAQHNAPRSGGEQLPSLGLSGTRERRTSLASRPMSQHATRSTTCHESGTASTFRVFDSLRDVTRDDTMALKGASKSLDEWLKGYDMELNEYASVAIYSEVKLQEALRMDAAHAHSVFRTSVCCDLFGKMRGLFGRYEELMGKLGGELMRAIFVDFDESKPPFSMTPFFLENDHLAKQVTQLRASLEALSDRRSMVAREARMRAQAIDMTAQHGFRYLMRLYIGKWRSACGDRRREKLVRVLMIWSGRKLQMSEKKASFITWVRHVTRLHERRTIQSTEEASDIKTAEHIQWTKAMQDKVNMHAGMRHRHDHEQVWAGLQCHHGPTH